MIRDIIENANYLLAEQKDRLLRDFDKEANPYNLSSIVGEAIIITESDIYDFLNHLLDIKEMELSPDEKLRISYWFRDRK